MTSQRALTFASPEAGEPRVSVRPAGRGPIVGQHPAIRAVLATIERVAPLDCAVLVTGESGTGKDLAVAALHHASRRGYGPLVALDCAAVPAGLLERELFGHTRGAFDDARVARTGRVAAAEGGTLFLDEVGALPLAVQAGVLRLIERGEYAPVGEARAAACAVRVVAASSHDLQADVASGRFRRDLYERLTTARLDLPPLRERGRDIELLAERFLRESAARAGRDDLRGFAPEAIALMCAHDWPGNVRALETAVERAVLLAVGPLIAPEDLPAPVRGGGGGASEAGDFDEHAARERPSVTKSGVMSSVAMPSAALPEVGIDLRAAVEEYENQLIRQALERTGWNKNRAAQLLGLNRTTLVEMVKRKRIGA